MFPQVSMRFTVVLCLVSLLASLSGVAADKPVYVDGIDAAFPPLLLHRRERRSDWL